MNKKVIYTCIIGDYDTLKEPLIKTKGWDYICFTDQEFKSDTWKIIKVGKSDVKEQRKKKIFNKFILDDYRASIWVDGSIYINTDLDEFVYQNCDSEFSLMKHPSRDCIYKEAAAVLMLGKDKYEIVTNQTHAYQAEGFPFNQGMVATGVMYRKHTEDVKTFCKHWWKQVDEYSHRDQLSFNYVDWFFPINYRTFSFNILRDSFKITNHK